GAARFIGSIGRTVGQAVVSKHLPGRLLRFMKGHSERPGIIDILIVTLLNSDRLFQNIRMILNELMELIVAELERGMVADRSEAVGAVAEVLFELGDLVCPVHCRLLSKG